MLGLVGAVGCASESDNNDLFPQQPTFPATNGDGDMSPVGPVTMPPTGDGDLGVLPPVGDGDMSTDDDSGMPMPMTMGPDCNNLNPTMVDVAALNLTECTRDMCTNAHCVPPNAVGENERARLGMCDDGMTLCVPDKLIASGGDFILDTCVSIAGSEGRCISSCVPQVADQADRLEQATCDDGELCAPCTDPLTGESTGVCGLSCDPGPAEEPLVFQNCCDDGSGSNPLGKCVPTDLVPEDQVDILPADECTAADYVCAPNIKIEDQSAKFPSCTTKAKDCNSVAQGATQASCVLGQALGLLDDKPGACVPICILELMTTGDASDPVMPAELYLQTDCDMGSICAPCENPTDNTPTGACE